MTDDQISASPSPEARTSVWEDFVDIFYAPSAVFARRDNNGFWIPLLVLTAAMVLLFLASSRVLEPIFDAEWNRNMAKMAAQNPQMDPAQLESGRAFFEKTQILFVALGTPIIVCFVGLVMWLVGKLFESKQTVRSGIVVAVYAYFPRLVEQIVMIAEGLVRDPSGLDGRFRVSWGIGRFLDPDTTSPAVLAILGRLDVFTIWVTVLIAIGLAVTGKIPRSRAAIAAALVWLVGAIPGILGGLRE